MNPIPTIVDMLQHHAVRRPDQRAFTFLADGETETTTLTYAELDRRARGIAATLRQHVQKGDRALLLYPPRLDFVTGFFGCLYAGVIAVPLYAPRLNRVDERLQRVVASCEPTILLSVHQVMAELEQKIDKAPWAERARRLATDTLPAEAGAGWVGESISIDDLAFLQYTSGSTSHPKGVMVSHGNLLSNTEMIRGSIMTHKHSVFLTWLPMYHDMGLLGHVAEAAYVGVHSILMPPAAFVQKPIRWLNAIKKYRATYTGAPNFGFELCNQKVTREELPALDLSSIESIYCGAEPIRPECLEEFATKFAACGLRRTAIYPCYGMAEATLKVTGSVAPKKGLALSLDRAAWSRRQVVLATSQTANPIRIANCSVPVPGLRVLIADPATRTALGEDQIGEIWLAGASICRGYWGQPELTEQTFRARLTGDEFDGPFLRTGDLGFLHAGELYVTGRLKDLIIIRGRNLYPQDIEFTTQSAHPGLQPAGSAAFSVDGDGQEHLAVVAEVQRSQVRAENHDEIINAIRRAVATEHDVEVEAVALLKPGGLLKTTSGKVRRSACRDALVAGTFEAIAQWQATKPQPRSEPAPAVLSLEARLVNWLAQRLNIAEADIPRDKPLGVVGLDSLGAVELIVTLETWTGQSVEPNIAWRDLTLRELIQRYTTGSAPTAPVKLQTNAEYLASLNSRMDRIKERGWYFFAPEISEYHGMHLVSNDRDLLMMSSYGYLGLLGHPKINQAAEAALKKFGTGTLGVRLLAGTTSLHLELERTIAAFKGVAAAITYSSGFMTNLATISALIGPDGWVICDSLDHASIVDGCAMSRARYVPFAHNDLASLRKVLQLAGKHRKLVIVDAVYSMDGDIAPLPEIVKLCREYDAWLMVDEAHSIGVLGKHGKGILEHFNLPADAVDIHMGTLSKTIPSIGGYVAGSAELINALRHNARGYIFSGALPPAQAAAAKAAFEVIASEPELMVRLNHNRERYVAGLRRHGFDLMCTDTAVVPILCRTEEIAYEMTRGCQENGVMVLPVVYPAVPVDAPRLRTTVTAAHSDADIDFAVDVLAKVGAKLGLIRA